MDPEHHTPNVAKSLFPKDRRFHEWHLMRKFEKEKTGPGQYDMLKIFDRNRVKPCTKIVKPELIDEQFYEIVGGDVKVCKPSLMNSKTRARHDLAINNFFRSGTTT
jgi:hypothetical protein